ncbi:MAG: hypothetical protein RJA15_1251 [Actinomycetota bacterium]|jgi:hypothetical protein
MFKNKVIAAIAVTSVFGLAACSGSSSDPKEGTATTLLQKNAALPPTTVRRTVTTPMPQLPGRTPTTVAIKVTTTAPKTQLPAPGTPTTVAIKVTTTAPKTVTTPMPQLPGK